MTNKEPSRHRFLETTRHRNELYFILFTVLVYGLGAYTRNIQLLVVAASFSLLEKYFSYSTLLSDLSRQYQVHLFDIFSAYVSHFLLFNSLTQALLIADKPGNYSISNPTDDFNDSVNYTLTISTTQGFGDMTPVSRASKYLQSAQTVDSLLLTLTFGAYILTSFIGKIKF